VEAGQHGVLPLDDRTIELFAAPPLPATVHARRDYTYYPPLAHIPADASPPLGSRSWTITAHVDVPVGGVEGVSGAGVGLAATGGAAGAAAGGGAAGVAGAAVAGAVSLATAASKASAGQCERVTSSSVSITAAARAALTAAAKAWTS